MSTRLLDDINKMQSQETTIQPKILYMPILKRHPKKIIALAILIPIFFWIYCNLFLVLGVAGQLIGAKWSSDSYVSIQYVTSRHISVKFRLSLDHVVINNGLDIQRTETTLRIWSPLEPLLARPFPAQFDAQATMPNEPIIREAIIPYNGEDITLVFLDKEVHIGKLVQK